VVSSRRKPLLLHAAPLTTCPISSILPGKHAQYKAQKMAVLKAFPLVPAAALTFALVQGQEFPKDQQLVVHFPQTNNASRE
jgi:hypothetical protein